ncbi:rhomboid family intramembrane serine protease [Rhodoluna limnophila]|uniref:rhomboid family intramembrane serine protease n=1 Tax=Rhodoluna limnophila TaxID=232537 RepID=UPI001107036D|nr:rhomboid family intramembrane serine protease [Rhodoluna limnophila]
MKNIFKRSPARVTLGLVSLNLAIWLLQIFPGSNLTSQLAFVPLSVYTEPWRMITAGFAHSESNPLHVLLNMYSLYIFGSILEPMLGRLRFLAVWLISVFGSSVAVMYLNTPDTWVIGASGGVFGLMAAYFVVLRAVGERSQSLLGLIAINLVFGFIMPGVSWQAHLGGLFAGGAMTAVYANTRNRNQRSTQLIGAIGVVLVFVALTFYRMQTMLMG